ncbi:MAG: MerR family transcriptional regulator [Gemmatimonadota bacterium]|jgi:DNA-binding transcriptional MerR regulator
MSDTWTVGEVAELAHVTVRTLHHYDEIGLLTPSDRTGSGYRLYSRSELDRLHQILLFRELGFGLEAVGHLLDDPTFDLEDALRAQRDLLTERVEKTEAIIRAVEAALESLEKGMPMSTERMFEGFEDFDHAEHAEEAEERWGGSEPWKESMRRARNYKKADWGKMKEEQDDIWRRMADAMAAGTEPTDDAAVALAEEARLLVDRWFYPCSHAMHVGLAAMYETDARFADFFEQRAEGLAAYAIAAIRENARRAEASEDA